MVRPLLESFWLSSVMPRPSRSTNNSLSAGLPTEDPLPSTATSESPVSSTASSSWSPQLADSLTEAVVRAIGNSIPAIISSIQRNASSQASSSVPGVSASGAPQPLFSSASTSSGSTSDGVSSVASGTFTLPAFVPTFTPVPAITVSSSARPVAPTPSTFVSPGVTSGLPSLESSLASPKSEKAFIVGPGHAPIPSKLVSKIVGGQFVELADLLSVNLRAVEQEPQTFLDGKLVVSSSKRRQVEIKDILTWTEAFTIFQMVLCAAHPHRWPDLSKYKLLIIQTARHFSSSAWLEYDLAFRKDAAASGLSDWSRMNLDLYNFHLRSPAMASPLPPRSSSSTASAPLPAASRDTSLVPPFCHSWNYGQCRWPFGRCKYRHRCSNCEGEHTQINCPFPNSSGARSRSPQPRRERGTVLNGRLCPVRLVYIV